MRFGLKISGFVYQGLLSAFLELEERFVTRPHWPQPFQVKENGTPLFVLFGQVGFPPMPIPNLDVFYEEMIGVLGMQQMPGIGQRPRNVAEGFLAP